MNPELVKLAQALQQRISALRQKGTNVTPAHIEEYVRAQTGGQYGREDMATAYNAWVASTTQGAPAGAGAPTPSEPMAPGVTPGGFAASALNQTMLGGLDELLSTVGAEGGAKFIRDQETAMSPSDRGAAGLLGSLPWMAVPSRLPIPRTATGRVAQATAVGAGVGGTAGALNAPEGQRMDGAMGGTLAGAAMSALPMAAIEGFNLMRPSVRAANRAMDAVRQTFSPRRPQDANLDNAIDATVMRAQEFEAAGKKPMFSDLSRPNLQQVDFAANNADEVLAPLTDQLERRQADQSRRLVTDLRQTLGFPVENVEARLAQLAASKAAWANSPKGFQGLREANTQIDPSTLARYFGTDDVQRQWGIARQAEDINATMIPPALQRVFTGGRNVGTPMRSGRAGATFTDLHDFRSLLDDRVTSNYNAGKGNLAGAYKALRNKVDEFLEAEVPGYRDVMAEYAKRSSAERALEQGAKDWTRRGDDLAETVRGMSAGELEEYRRGMAGAIASELRNAQTNRAAAAQLINRSQTMDEKLQLVFGNKTRFESFMRRAQMEADMTRSLSATRGSSTHRRRAAAGGDPVQLMAVAGTVPSNAIVPVLAAKDLPGRIGRATAQEMGPLSTASSSDALDRLLRGLQKKASPPLGAFGNALPVLNGMLAPSLLQDNRSRRGRTPDTM